jgi:transcription initiation factor TFIIB
MKTINSTSNNDNASSIHDHLLLTDPQSGEVICKSCGQVLTDTVQLNNVGWCSFNTVEENTKSRPSVSTSLARHDMGLATIIGRTNKDASGNMLNAEMRSTMDKLRIWDLRTKAITSTDRNFISAFKQLDKLKDKLRLSGALIEKTAYIYRKAQERALVRGRTITAVMAAAAYISCREMGMTRTLDDIATAANIRYKDLSRTYRLLVTELDIKVPSIDPTKCISRIANNLGLKEITKRRAIAVMYEVTRKGISAGKDPMGLAAAVLYFASDSTGDEYVTQMKVADAAGVTEVTLRNRFKELESKLQILN